MRRKMSTAKLAEICGVSQGTVDRALNNRGGIKPETRERILRIAKEYGYRPNIQSFNRATGKSGVIGIVIQVIHNSANSDLLMRFSKYCCENNYSMVVMFSYSDKNEEKRCKHISGIYQQDVLLSDTGTCIFPDLLDLPGTAAFLLQCNKLQWCQL